MIPLEGKKLLNTDLVISMLGQPKVSSYTHAWFILCLDWLFYQSGCLTIVRMAEQVGNTNHGVGKAVERGFKASLIE